MSAYNHLLKAPGTDLISYLNSGSFLQSIFVCGLKSLKPCFYPQWHQPNQFVLNTDALLKKIASDGPPTKIEKTSGKTSGKMSGKMSGKILAYIQENNQITLPELSELIGITERSIERNLQKLQEQNKLKRVGGAKGGFWQISK